MRRLKNVVVLYTRSSKIDFLPGLLSTTIATELLTATTVFVASNFSPLPYWSAAPSHWKLSRKQVN